MNLKTHALFRYRIGFIRNGKRYLLPFRNNLILDSGLNNLSLYTYAQMFQYCLFGDTVSPDPVQRNSGAVTFTTTGTACVASGNFFAASDVGRLIKFDDTDGQERYITGYTSATSVTLGVAPSPAIAGDTGTVWYVNQTSLSSVYSSTASYGVNPGDNGTSIAGNVVTMKRTYVGSAVAGSPVTLTDIGFNFSSANSDIFDRDIIPGGITLQIGDIPTAIGELVLTLNHTTPLSQGNVATGYDSSGESQLTTIYGQFNVGLSQVNSSGGSDNPNVTSIDAGNLEPAQNLALHLMMSNFSIPSFSTAYGGQISTVKNDSRSVAGYVSGNFYRDWTCNFSITLGVGTIYGFACNTNVTDIWMYKFTTPFAKAGTQTLSFTVRKSWQRILTN